MLLATGAGWQGRIARASRCEVRQRRPVRQQACLVLVTLVLAAAVVGTARGDADNGCPSALFAGVTWPGTLSGGKVTRACPTGSSGDMARPCCTGTLGCADDDVIQGGWKPLDSSGCTNTDVTAATTTTVSAANAAATADALRAALDSASEFLGNTDVSGAATTVRQLLQQTAANPLAQVGPAGWTEFARDLMDALDIVAQDRVAAYLPASSTNLVTSAKKLLSEAVQTLLGTAAALVRAGTNSEMHVSSSATDMPQCTWSGLGSTDSVSLTNPSQGLRSCTLAWFASAESLQLPADAASPSSATVAVQAFASDGSSFSSASVALLLEVGLTSAVQADVVTELGEQLRRDLELSDVTEMKLLSTGASDLSVAVKLDGPTPTNMTVKVAPGCAMWDSSAWDFETCSVSTISTTAIGCTCSKTGMIAAHLTVESPPKFGNTARYILYAGIGVCIFMLLATILVIVMLWKTSVVHTPQRVIMNVAISFLGLQFTLLLGVVQIGDSGVGCTATSVAGVYFLLASAMWVLADAILPLAMFLRKGVGVTSLTMGTFYSGYLVAAFVMPLGIVLPPAFIVPNQLYTRNFCLIDSDSNAAQYMVLVPLLVVAVTELVVFLMTVWRIKFSQLGAYLALYFILVGWVYSAKMLVSTSDAVFCYAVAGLAVLFAFALFYFHIYHDAELMHQARIRYRRRFRRHKVVGLFHPNQHFMRALGNSNAAPGNGIGASTGKDHYPQVADWVQSAADAEVRVDRDALTVRRERLQTLSSHSEGISVDAHFCIRSTLHPVRDLGVVVLARRRADAVAWSRVAVAQSAHKVLVGVKQSDHLVPPKPPSVPNASLVHQLCVVVNVKVKQRKGEEHSKTCYCVAEHSV
eukprot:m.108609 g.108609  ORF g.108609 m.108609 type:complete len:867 (-) comp15930_c0_seq1:2243-4843(-)